MRHPLRISVGIVTCLFITAAVYFFWPDSSASGGETSRTQISNLQVEVKTQPREKRTFKDVTPELESRIDGSTGTVLYKPGIIRMAPNGDLLVLDFGDLRLKRFTPRGDRVCFYGKGEGEGPGEFLHPIAFDATPSGRVVVADAELRRLTTFTADCKLVSTRDVQEPLHRMVLTSDSGRTGFYFAPQYHAQEKGLLRFATADTSTNFGRLLPESAPSGIPSDGFIAAAREDVIYSPYYYPVLLRYDETGSIVWARTTIDHSLGGIGPSDRDERKGPLPTTRYKRDVSIDAESVYTYATQPSSDSGRTVIDVYGLTDGTYEFSYRFPIEARGAKIENNYLYALQDTTALIYSL